VWKICAEVTYMFAYQEAISGDDKTDVRSPTAKSSVWTIVMNL